MTHLWTPWRSAYMQEKKDRSRCIFCDALVGSSDEENLVIYRGESIFAMLNRYPYTSGHLMIAPNVHVCRLAQISDRTADEIMDLTRRAEEIIEEVYHPDGLNIGMNLGRAAGAGIEQHIHMHVLPRWNGDANFMTSVSNTRVIPESLCDTYAKLRKAFSSAPKLREH
jgi:ATP adenylyltransferase